MNFARIFARISLVFLLKMRPYFARIFTKMSPYEELVTLYILVSLWVIMVKSNPRLIFNFRTATFVLSTEPMARLGDTTDHLV